MSEGIPHLPDPGVEPVDERCKRFIRWCKEKRVRQHSSESIEQARSVIGRWIRWYNAERPHQDLGYRSPEEAHTALRRNAT